MTCECNRKPRVKHVEEDKGPMRCNRRPGVQWDGRGQDGRMEVTNERRNEQTKENVPGNEQKNEQKVKPENE